MSAGLGRLRIALVGLAMIVVAGAASGIFDRWIWQLPVSALLPAAGAFVLHRRSRLVRAFGIAVTVPGSVALIVLLAGGTLADIAGAVIDGPQGLLTTEWPSPDRAELIGAVAALIAVCTALAGNAAGSARWHLMPFAPVVLAYVVVTALSAPLGVRLWWLAPLGLAFAGFATLRPSTGLTERWMLLRGERRLVPIVLVAAAVAGAVSVPVALADRADPRRNEVASSTAPLLDPIEATLALRSIDPPIAVLRISADTTDPLPTRWRTAALTSFDGQRWTPALTLRPIGRRLGSGGPDELSYDVVFLADELELVPLPGAPVTVDGEVETDPARAVVRLSARRDPTDPLAVTALIAPASIAATDRVATRPVDESVSGLSEFAAELAGNGTVVEQLRRIETTMRDDFVLSPDVPGGGLQRALIERFLRDTRRGNAEQFATAFVLLARSLGVDARVATGFVTAAPAGGEIVLSSADAVVWPEVHLLDGGWVAFDPVPTEEASDSTPPPEDPAVQTPAAAQPPIAPPPEPVDEAADNDSSVDDTASTALSALQTWAVRIAVGTTVLFVPILLAMAVVIGLKRRRRRRRLTADSPSERIVGAWAEATDRLVDAGLTIAPAATNGDIAAIADTVAASSHRELRHLASLSSAVTFGHPPRTEHLATDARDALERVEEAMAADRTRSERWRWRLSARSLRRSTRSPVAP